MAKSKKIKIVRRGARIDVDLGTKITTMGERLGDPKELMAVIGLTQVGRLQESFDTHRRGSEKWAPRGGDKLIKNIAAMLVAFSEGSKAIRPQWLEAEKGLLTGTGRLKGSMTFQVQGKDSVLIGTNVPYAQKVQDGGEINIKINAQMRRTMIDIAKKQQELRPQLEMLIPQDAYESRMKPRTIVSVSDDELDDMILLAQRFFGLVDGAA